MSLRSISDLDVFGKRIVVRADLNVPVNGDVVTDTTRITRFAKGMRLLLDRGARLVILTHFGRPTPGRNEPELSVERLVAPLAEALGTPVKFAPGCADQAAYTMSQDLKRGEAMLCENLRFDAGETTNAPAFAESLARLGDIYVNDAFSCAHRAHASTDALARLLPAASGPLLLQETKALSAALDAPARPSIAIVGGAKVSSKIDVLKHLVTKLDAIIIGGGMANTFLHAMRKPMGKSLHEPDLASTVRDITRIAHKHKCRILLPSDVVVARDFAAGAASEVVSVDACPPDAMILDAGPATLAQFQAELAQARTILWNGPLGAFEIPPFDRATTGLARTAAALSRAGLATAVAGGGDTVAALNGAGVAQDFTYVSTAGGAFLEWLEGKTLPGIAALETAARAA